MFLEVDCKTATSPLELSLAGLRQLLTFGPIAAILSLADLRLCLPFPSAGPSPDDGLPWHPVPPVSRHLAASAASGDVHSRAEKRFLPECCHHPHIPEPAWAQFRCAGRLARGPRCPSR